MVPTMRIPTPPRGSRSRRAVLGLVVFGLTTLLLVALPGPAAAHLYLKSSDPERRTTVREAPSRVVLEFSEPVDLDTARVNVLDPDETRVDRGQVRQVGDDPYTVQIGLAEDLQNGQYTVVWRLIAQDGHPRTERFRFRLRAPAPPSPTPEEEEEAPGHGEEEAEAPAILGPEADEIAGSHLGRLAGVLQSFGKFFVFASLLALAGLVGFLLLVWRRPSGLPAEDAAEVEERFARRWRRLIGVAWVGAILGSLVTLVLQGAIIADVPLSRLRPAMVGEALDTRFGQTVLWRLGILAVGAGVWALASRITAAPLVLRPGGRRPVTVGAEAAVAPALPRVMTWVAGLFVVALLVTVSFAGHAGTASPVALNLPVDVLHLLAAGVWLGGLMTLLVAGFPSTRGVGEVERCRILAPAIARFSDLAVVAIVVIVASGVVRSLVELQGLDGLTTSYGWVLLAKVGAFVPVVVLGAINNRRTKPACVRAAEAGTSTPALGTLRRLITIEVIVGILVIGLAAFLVNLNPPRTMGAEPGMHALLP